MPLPSKKEIEAELKEIYEMNHGKTINEITFASDDVFTFKEQVEWVSSIRERDLSAIIEWVKGEKVTFHFTEYVSARIGAKDPETAKKVGYNQAIDDFVAHLTSLQETI